MSPAKGACARAAEAPHVSGARPARDAASAEPAALAELFQVKAWVRAAGWTAFSVRTFSRTSVGGYRGLRDHHGGAEPDRGRREGQQQRRARQVGGAPGCGAVAARRASRRAVR
jgi:hypothetical protein